MPGSTAPGQATPDRATPARAAPDRDCALCPRLAAFRAAHRAAEPLWFNAPVPSFGPDDAPLLVVGLAPGLRGANRTGRPFTGDFAGEVLYPTLSRHGLAAGRFAASSDDGFTLLGCRVTNAVRCVPPANKPIPAEITTCRRFLLDELAGAAPPRLILALGRIAHETVLRAVGAKPARHPFAHGGWHRLPTGQTLLSSFHTSRYNVNTGKLTPAMFEAVVAAAVRLLAEPPAAVTPAG
ncbi:MAG: uracil-DNA glycosylase [Geminicoccaceae bacterium]